MGGKSAASGPSGEQQYVYDQFYDAAQSGTGYYYGGAPRLESAAQAGYAAGGGGQSQSSGPSLESALGTQQANFEKQQADIAAQQAQAQQDAIRRTNESLINQLYSSKFAAANMAAEAVNQKIAEEAGYARVGGADYAVSEADKAERINNKFASLWSAEQESKLSGLEKQWGSAGNKWTSGIVRGVVSEEDIANAEGDSAGGKVASGKVFGSTNADDEKDLLGGDTQVLGSV